MGELKTKVRKTMYWLKHDLLVFDNIVLIVAIICCLAWTWGSISAMSRNWSLAEEVMSRNREKALLELEVETLELENEYYASAEYQELAARKYQNKKFPGEVIIYLPANSDAAKTKHSAVATSTELATELQMTNWEQWLAFLLGI